MDVLRDIKNPYCVLLEDIKKLMAGLTEQQIKDAVESFREQIQSNRVASYIKDISGLISILEARNVLHSKNVDALLLISQTVNHPLAIKMVENYKRYKEPTVRSLPSKIPARSPLLSPQEQQRENGMMKKFQQFNIIYVQLTHYFEIFSVFRSSKTARQGCTPFRASSQFWTERKRAQ